MTDALAQFNDQQEIEKACNTVRERMTASAFDEPEMAENLRIMELFANIAITQMIRKEGGIPVPGDPNQKIPYDLRMAQQTMTLFTEGMYHAFVKCRELKITHDKMFPQGNPPQTIKSIFLQQLAMSVFTQVNNVVASTLGQDSLPEFKISEDQQLALIHQTVEGELLYMATEYEKQYGPISPEDNMDLLGSASAVASTPSPAAAPAPLPPPAASAPSSRPQSPVSPTPPKGPSPHDKYAAVALALETMPAKRKEKVLGQFNADEKELINHYRDVAKIEANLDLASVESHLKRFSEMLSSGKPGLKTKASDGIRELVAVSAPEALEAAVAHERPLIKKYLGDVLGDAHPDHPSPLVTASAASNDYLPPLSPKMEEVLYRYLHKLNK